jgi:hypothetical protein
VSVPGIRRFFRIAGTARSVERDVNDELRFHLDMRAEELTPRYDARRRARAGTARVRRHRRSAHRVGRDRLAPHGTRGPVGMVGQLVAGCALRRSRSSCASGLHDGRPSHARPRHRGKHCDLRSASSASSASSGRTCVIDAGPSGPREKLFKSRVRGAMEAWLGGAIGADRPCPPRSSACATNNAQGPNDVG